MAALKSLLLAIVIILLIIGAGLILLDRGLYDVAADARGSSIAKRFIVFVRNRSIDARAHDISVPPLNDPRMLALGAAHYAEMCTTCHLAPGSKDSELRAGLDPMPPNLTREGGRLRPAKTYWIIKHGIRMTAMPAWGRTHDDRALWALTAFVEKLPTLSAGDYHKLLGQSGGDTEQPADDEHEHEHEHSP